MRRALNVLALASGLLALTGAGHARAQGPTPAPPQAGEPTADVRPQQPPRRPRIGLVLSGGAARGCAHLGVIKVLEELHVPVDVIAGVSMGAVVGGAYAAGLSSDEIEQILTGTDWHDVFTDRRARKDLPFRRKEEDWRYLTDIDLGIGHGRISPRRGLIAGQKLNFLLARHTLRVAGTEDFDRLPIPFRCVATDLVTGKKVVLGRGDLATALRASMAIPAVFTPVEDGNMLLVDGGLTDNLPVDVARAMGAEVVIAVNVGTPLGGRERLDSMVGIADQVSDLLGQSTVQEQLASADVVITPEMENVNSMDFPRAAEIIRIGQVAAWKASEALARYAAPEEEYRRFLARQHGLPFAPVTIKFVKSEGITRVDPEVVTSRITTRPGELLDLDALRDDLTRLYETGDFETVNFRLTEVAGEWGLVIVAKEQTWGPDYLRLSLNVVDDLQGNNSFSALGNYTKTHINRLGAEWRTDLQAGRTRRASTEFYQPLSLQGGFFVAPGAEQTNAVLDLFDQGRKVDEYAVTTTLGHVDLGANLGRIGELRVGLLGGSGQAETNVGVAGFPKVDVKIGGATTRLVVDRLDNVDFPHHGVYGVLQGFFSRRSLGADSPYDKLSGAITGYTTRGRQTLFAGLAGGTSLGSSIPVYDEFTLGGFLSFSGYREYELRGQYFGVARAGYFMHLWQLSGAFFGGVYCGGWVEAGNAWEERREIGLANLRYAATAACGMETLFGPFYLAVGQADHGQGRAYLSLGRRIP